MVMCYSVLLRRSVARFSAASAGDAFLPLPVGVIKKLFKLICLDYRRHFGLLSYSRLWLSFPFSRPIGYPPLENAAKESASRVQSRACLRFDSIETGGVSAISEQVGLGSQLVPFLSRCNQCPV